MKALNKEIAISFGSGYMRGILSVPAQSNGLALFAHGSGSSRFSPRNQFVAGALNKAGIATMLLDLLTPDEEADRSNVFDIDLLSERLALCVKWVKGEAELKKLPIGFFGASTGAGAALKAAAKLGKDVRAVVSRGGRPDLAMPFLPKVTAPTLLIVGGDDGEVIALNEAALAELNSEKKLVIVPGATHLFEEEGKLEEVAKLAKEWFVKFFGS